MALAAQREPADDDATCRGDHDTAESADHRDPRRIPPLLPPVGYTAETRWP
jgi:hypothetical protein